MTDDKQNEKLDINEIKELIKELSTIGGIVALILVYGPSKLWTFVAGVFGKISNKTFIAANRLKIFLNEDGTLALKLVVSTFYKALKYFSVWISFSIIVVYFCIKYIFIGMNIGGSIGAETIVYAGLFAAGWFFLTTFIIEKLVLLAGAGLDVGKGFLNRFSKLLKALLKKQGIELDDDCVKIASKERTRDVFKELRFFAIPLLGIAFWLSLAIYFGFKGRDFYTFLLIVCAGGLMLMLISYWKEWSSVFWKVYHTISIIMVVVAVIIFAVNTIVYRLAPKTHSAFVMWLKRQDAQYAGEFLAKPKKVDKKALISKKFRKIVLIKPIDVPGDIPVSLVTPSQIRRYSPSISTYGSERQAALVAYLKMKRMDEEDAKNSLKGSAVKKLRSP